MLFEVEKEDELFPHFPLTFVSLQQRTFTFFCQPKAILTAVLPLASLQVLAWASLASLVRAAPRGILYTLLRDNVAGAPVVHQKQDWAFDPDVGLRRRDEFQRMHGYRAYNLVAQAGLGEDGRMEERRQQQAYRDTFPVPAEADWQPGQASRRLARHLAGLFARPAPARRP